MQSRRTKILPCARRACIAAGCDPRNSHPQFSHAATIQRHAEHLEMLVKNKCSAQVALIKNRRWPGRFQLPLLLECTLQSRAGNSTRTLFSALPKKSLFGCNPQNNLQLKSLPSTISTGRMLWGKLPHRGRPHSICCCNLQWIRWGN